MKMNNMTYFECYQEMIRELVEDTREGMLSLNEKIHLIREHEGSPFVDWCRPSDQVPGIHEEYTVAEAITLMTEEIIAAKSNIVTVKEASELLGVNIEGLKRACQKGQIEARKSGATWLVSLDSAKKYYQDKNKVIDRQ